MKPEPSPFLLYEHTVQSPNWQVEYLPQFHEWLTGKKPVSMREDFCGTAQISCEWVKLNPKNRAVGLDLDPEVIAYAKSVNVAALTSQQKKQVQILKQDVLKPTREKFDMIGAYNFSFFIFHERAELLKYAKAAYASLKSKGTFFLEIAGGEGFLESSSEGKTTQILGVGKVEKAWEQHQYDPITCVNDYSIHFKLPGGKWMMDAFTYHWRIWGMREVREILIEAGFKRTVVLWEHEDNKDEWVPAEEAASVHYWLAYIIGVK